MAITKEQIFSVAGEIVAAGGTATLAAVRKAVGGGSYTTISEALKEWRASAVPVPAVLREPAPQVLSDRLADVINETWSMALEMANDRLKTERDALALVRADLEAARLEAADLADQLSADLEAAQGVIAGHVAAAAVSAAALAQALDDSAKLAVDLSLAGDDARTAKAALAESRDRVKELAGLLAGEQAAHVAALERAGQAEKSASVLGANLEAEQKAGVAAAAAAGKIEQALQARLDAAAADLAAARAAAVKTEARLDGLAADLAALRPVPAPAPKPASKPAK